MYPINSGLVPGAACALLAARCFERFTQKSWGMDLGSVEKTIELAGAIIFGSLAVCYSALASETLFFFSVASITPWAVGAFTAYSIARVLIPRKDDQHARHNLQALAISLLAWWFLNL